MTKLGSDVLLIHCAHIANIVAERVIDDEHGDEDTQFAILRLCNMVSDLRKQYSEEAAAKREAAKKAEGVET